MMNIIICLHLLTKNLSESCKSLNNSRLYIILSFFTPPPLYKILEWCIISGTPFRCLDDTRCLKNACTHQMLCSDLYTYQMKADYQGGSPHCRLCQQPSENNENVENLEHILTKCNAYSEVRVRINAMKLSL